MSELNSGWICLHRKILNWEWYGDVNVRIVFLHLLLTANYFDNYWKGTLVRRGQKITSRENLAKEVGLSIQQIRTALNKLKSTNEITVETTNRYMLVTIVKYSDYQNKEEENNQQNNQESNFQSTNNQPSNNHQITTNKQYNNITNNIYFNLLNKYKSTENFLVGLDVINKVRADEDYKLLSTEDQISLEMELTL